ncbi:MAG: KH domain-containing protein [Clostridia bacterium]|nr:KH domain-containing protein [Eubacteriales bacterium]MDD3867593.1 KH domain-containing protein [Eubacteriales bacterium]MDD4461934.1 KH domain-containing protein [Eubacteriales bacterium]NCC49364.1 KH domain-containing protein [Clostridia bacterium]
MKALLQTIINPLVSHPELIKIEEIDQGRTVVLELQVAPDDMGKVIGKQGRRAQAIRSVMKALATRQGKRVIVNIGD